MAEERQKFNFKDFNVNENCFIEASAGTGKTYSIQRMVLKILGKAKTSPDIDLSNILLVTYTEKAAGELKTRIRNILEETSDPSNEKFESNLKEVFGELQEKDKDDLIKKFKRALMDIENASIFTIHSFCKRVLSSYAFEAGVATTLDNASSEIIENLVEKACRDEWIFDPEFEALLSNDKNIKTTIEKLIKKVVSVVEIYEPETMVLENLEDEVDLLENAEKSTLFVKNLTVLENFSTNPVNEMQLIVSAIVKELKNADANKKLYNFNDVKKTLKKDNINKQEKDIKKEIIPELLKSDVEVGKSLQFFTELREKKTLKESIEQKFDKTKENLFIFKQSRKIYETWQQLKKDNKEQSFNDMIVDVKKELKSLIPEIKNKYKYAIIDEFQDTNLLQWTIFKSVFLNSTENHIYVVGDPKQSIYAFQGANLEVYKKAIKEIGIGRKLDTNYRSSKDLVNACNDIFNGDWFKGAFDAQVNASDNPSPLFCNKEFAPVWVSPSVINAIDYAEYALEKLSELFKLDKSGLTALQIPVKTKDDVHFRNVQFSDIAILYRTASELPKLEERLKEVGIPFLRYKDRGLFEGKECLAWKTLLEAINTPDNSFSHQKKIRGLLLSDFLRVSNDLNILLPSVIDFDFDKKSKALEALDTWRALARKEKWAQLLESIYELSMLEQKLNTPSKMQSLAKYRQVGDYIISLLYKGESLECVAKHLDNLHNKIEEVPDELKTVAKGTENQAVQLMTIHASKGLEFPVVISLGGIKGSNTQADTYFENVPDEEGNPKRYIKLASTDKSKKEEVDEWRRLFYVSFTRAKYLLILPRYQESKKKGSPNPHQIFIQAALEANKDNPLFKFDEELVKLDNEKLNEISEIFAQFLPKNESATSNDLKEENEILQAQLNEIKKKPLYKISTSYSQIAHGTSEGFTENGTTASRENKDGSPEVVTESNDEINETTEEIICKSQIKEDINFPKGASLGSAIHEVFEKGDFSLAHKNQNDLFIENGKSAIPEMERLIKDAFLHYSLEPKCEWILETTKLYWQTLNAKLPHVDFKLKDLPPEDRIAEMRYDVEFYIPEKIKREYLCKGFMDLVFRKDGKYYVLDWKSDIVKSYHKEALFNKIQECGYDIQRVLYSYFLIEWLRNFYKVSAEEIFEKYFGGIYYVFFRGCTENSEAGIYGEKFENYEELKNAYEKIILEHCGDYKKQQE